MSNPDTVPYCERGIAWIFDHVDPKFYGNPDFPLCDPRDVAEHFYVSYFDEVNGRYTHIQKVLEVHEHDIFGTSLKLIINETHDWFIDSNTCTIGRNSHKIQGATADMTVTTERAAFTLVYVDSTQGWLLDSK